MAEIDQPLFLNDVIYTSSSGDSIETEPLLLAGSVSQPPAWEGAPPLLVDPQRWGISVSRSGKISVSVVTARCMRRGLPRPLGQSGRPGGGRRPAAKRSGCGYVG